jgi:Bacterial Ig domain
MGSIFCSASFGLIVSVLLFSAIFTGVGYAQLIPQTSKSASNSVPASGSKPSLHLVKILTPTKGQQVPAGRDLLISGTSADNATSGCKVSIKVNGVSPYQDTLPSGHVGQQNYSKWTFTLTSAYTLVNPGANKITAKFSCSGNPILLSHTSVNVTGVPTATAADLNPQNKPIGGPASGASNSTISKTVSNLKSPTPSDITSTPGNNKIKAGKSMSISIRFAKSSVLPGKEQTITLKVVDANLTTPIANASVVGNITKGAGLIKKFEGTTDGGGTASYSWNITKAGTTGKYNVAVQVSAPYYESQFASKSFKVSSSPFVSTNIANFVTSSQHIHPSTIIPIPHIRIPIIKIPFQLPFH